MNLKDALGKRIPELGEGLTFSLRRFFHHDLNNGHNKSDQPFTVDRL